MSFTWIVSLFSSVVSFFKAIPQGIWAIIVEILRTLGDIALHMWDLCKLVYELVISILQIIAGRK